MDFNDNKILIEHLKKEDEKAYVFLINKYHKKLYIYALSLIDDHFMAEDIVQEVFLRIWRFRIRLNEKFNLQSFLYKSVYNEFINKYRQNKSLSLLEQQYVKSLDKVVEKKDDDSLNKKIKQLYKIVDTLPKKSRDIFNLSKREGLSNREISDYLKVSVKTVERHISNVYQIIAEKLPQ